MAKANSTSSTSEQGDEESAVEKLFQQAQDELTDITVMAHACKALIVDEDDAYAINMLDQLIEKSEALANAVDAVNVVRVMKGGAA